MNGTYGNAIVFDDQELFADAFAMLLQKLGLFHTVYSFTDEASLMQLFSRKQQGELYLFCDYLVPGCNVHYLISDIRRLHRGLKLIIVSTVTGKPLVEQAMALSPNGFISKALGAAELVDCINEIGNDRVYLAPNIRQVLEETAADQPLVSFTVKEIEVLKLITKGHGIKQIAEQMNISHHTVVSHRRNMMAKTKCNSVTALISYVVTHGIINLQPTL